MAEVDYELATRADIHDGFRRPLVNVCPEPSLRFVHHGVQGSLAAICAKKMADDSTLSDGRAYRLDELDVDAVNGKFTVFLLDDAGNGYEALRVLYQRSLARQIPFEHETAFAFLLLSGGRIESLVRLLQKRFLALGAVEITPLQVMAEGSQSARLQDINAWQLNVLQRGFLTLMRRSAVERELFIARRTHPDKAYAVVNPRAFAPIPLGGGRGHVYKGVMLPWNGEFFMNPSEEAAVHVAIKVLDLEVVRHHLGRGSNENPWRELYWLLQLQNTGFVPEFIESLLVNERYLCIITRWAEGGSLPEVVRQYPRNQMPIARARSVARQIFDILQVLHEQFGIVHHDLKPSNFLMHRGRVLVTDFAQSVPIPPGGRLPPVNVPQGLRGTLAFMPPEHFAGQDYDARQLDLWSVGTTLLALVTGQSMMYRFPSAHDYLFEYVILTRQVSRVPQNPQVQAMLDQLNDRIALVTGYMEIAVVDEFLDQSPQNEERAAALTNYLEDLYEKRSDMITLAARIRALPDNLLELFERVLDPDPQHRWPRERLAQMPWMANTNI